MKLAGHISSARNRQYSYRCTERLRGTLHSRDFLSFGCDHSLSLLEFCIHRRISPVSNRLSLLPLSSLSLSSLTRRIHRAVYRKRSEDFAVTVWKRATSARERKRLSLFRLARDAESHFEFMQYVWPGRSRSSYRDGDGRKWDGFSRGVSGKIPSVGRIRERGRMWEIVGKGKGWG